MGHVSETTKERIRNEVNFADVLGQYTRTQKPGQNKSMWFCPFHNDVRRPAMSVELDRQVWHCFVCDMGGDIFDFVMEKENLGFKEAARLLCEQHGIEYEETGGGADDSETRSLYPVLEEAQRFFVQQLECSDEAKAYLEERNFLPETIEKWGIGYAPGKGTLRKHLLSKGYTEDEMKAVKLISEDGQGRDFFYDRLMFPIANTIGKTIAFGGRILGPGNPKYLNSSDNPLFHKRQALYGLHIARKSIGKKDAAILAEGYVDTDMLHQAGVDNAVATLGTAVTPENLANLARMAKNIYISLDNDAAGLKAAREVAENLDGSLGVSVFAIVLPREPILDSDGEPVLDSHGEPTFVKDPDDYFNRAGHTAEDYLELQANAPGIFTFVTSRIVGSYDLTKSSEKEKAYNEAVEFLEGHRNAITMFQGLDTCELLVKALDLGVSGYELYAKLFAGKTGGLPPASVQRGADSSLELNVLRLLLDYPKRHRLFEEGIVPEFFQDPTNYVIYQRMLEAINAREDLGSLHFDDGETEKAWARFLLSNPETSFDEGQADTAIRRNIDALRRLRLKSLIEHLETEKEPDYDRLFALKMELAKLR